MAIETLRHERIEQLYYKSYPQNVKELMVRPDIVPELIVAIDRGGDDLYRFNLIIVLNHRSALGDSERVAIVQSLEQALKDPFSWVRTEAVWGVGELGSIESISRVIPLLDDPDPNVVNETVLTLAKFIGMPNAPISNQDMPADDRREIVEFLKDWWEKVRPELSQ